MRRIRPALLVLAELEIWPNLILAARQSGARVAVFNGRLSHRSYRGYRRVRPLIRWLLQQLDAIAVQDGSYAWRFESLGARAQDIAVTGSMKFDGAQTSRDNPATSSLAPLWPLEKGNIVFLAGSTQAPEESVAIDVFRRLSGEFPQLQLVICPRHPERFQEVAALLDHSGLAWQRRSELVAGTPKTARVLLVDSVGELAGWWGVAEIAFVGGSLGSRGGQNMVEPAAYGAAVCFGPNTRNFRDIVRMLWERDAAVVVRDAGELQQFVARCLEDADYRRTLGAAARQLVLEQRGAADRTLRFIQNRCQLEPTLRAAG
jgi:3-deoxy-D-manno-octulosonic-acid transferase